MSKSTRKKQIVLTVILALFFVSVSLSAVYAQGTISGDSICGATAETACGVAHFKQIFSNFLTKLIVPIGSAALVLFIIYRVVMAYFALRMGNASAYKDALNKISNAILGFIIILLILTGFLWTLLKFLGAQPWVATFIRLISQLNEPFVQIAYAQGGATLPNPLAIDNLYDFLLALVRLVIRWFLFPAVIVMWVWTGFSFVAAQGNPEKLKDSRRWLFWATITTFIIMITQGFLFALRGSIQQIIGG